MKGLPEQIYGRNAVPQQWTHKTRIYLILRQSTQQTDQYLGCCEMEKLHWALVTNSELWIGRKYLLLSAT